MTKHNARGIPILLVFVGVPVWTSLLILFCPNFSKFTKFVVNLIKMLGISVIFPNNSICFEMCFQHINFYLFKNVCAIIILYTVTILLLQVYIDKIYHLFVFTNFLLNTMKFNFCLYYEYFIMTLLSSCLTLKILIYHQIRYIKIKNLKWKFWKWLKIEEN